MTIRACPPIAGLPESESILGLGEALRAIVGIAQATVDTNDVAHGCFAAAASIAASHSLMYFAS